MELNAEERHQDENVESMFKLRSYTCYIFCTHLLIEIFFSSL